MTRPRLRETLALTVIGLVVVGSYGRMMDGLSWLVPFAASTIFGLATTLGLRRLGLWRSTAWAVSICLSLWFVMIIVVPSSLFHLLPDASAIRAAFSSMSDAIVSMSNQTPPLNVTPGLLMLMMGVVSVAAATSAALLGGRSTLVAPFPWIALFAHLSLNGRSGPHLVSLASLVVGLAALLGATDVGRWGDPGPEGAPGPSQWLRNYPKGAAARLVGFSVLGAISLPTFLLGADPHGLVTLRPGGSSAGVSPVLEIGARLGERSRDVMFRVQTTRARYWRLTALEGFDGSSWREVPPRQLGFRNFGNKGTADSSRFVIAKLGGHLIPAPLGTIGLRGIAADQRVSTETWRSSQLREGISYVAISLAGDLAPRDFQGATSTGAPAQDLDLPSGFPQAIRDLAVSLTDGAGDQYDRVIAIQRYLRTFRYNDRIPSDDSSSFMLRFLTQDKEGFCVQFAGSMAAMLRSIGIPARVAIGFLPGTRSGDSFTVRGTHAHAWPEVYFDKLGWVAFEPTPRRSVEPPSYADPAQASPASPAPSVSPSIGSTASPTPKPRLTETDVGSSDTGRPRSAFGATYRILVSLLSLLMFLAAVKVVSFRAPTYVARILHRDRIAESCFFEVCRRGNDVFRPRNHHETEHEYISALEAHLALRGQGLSELLAIFDRSRYGNPSSRRDDSDRDRAIDLIGALRRAMWRQAGWAGRARSLFDPRAPLARAASGLRGLLQTKRLQHRFGAGAASAE